MYKVFLLIFLFISSDLFAKSVGIVLDKKEIKDGDGSKFIFDIDEKYLNAVRGSCKKYDISVVFLPYAQDYIDNYVKDIDGLLISDSIYDIDPSLYGQHLNKDTKFILNDARSNFEIGLLQAFLKLGRPVLGIGHGMHVLNVARGGSLIQDLSTSVKTEINHNSSYTKHEVVIEKNNKLSKIIFKEDEKDTNIITNSLHKQSIAAINESFLKISGRAKDGVIEAIEGVDSSFVFGIQWHPELLENEHDIKLFDAFCSAVNGLKRSDEKIEDLEKMNISNELKNVNIS